MRYRDKALKQEAKAAKASKEKSRERALKKAQKHYAKAIEKQGEAIRLNPRNYEAANELGYALRKTGDFRKAIGAYNYALEINPNFHEAVEYRAEAFLHLGLLSETRDAYMVLFRNDRTLADQLMESLDRWRAERTGNMTESETAFAAWIAERKRIAEMSDALSYAPGKVRPSWSGD